MIGPAALPFVGRVQDPAAHAGRLTDMEKQAFRVLLVDDDEDEYVVIRDMLAAANTSKYDLGWVNTYDDGLKAIGRSKYDAVLIDYRLGERNGLELLRQVIKKELNAAAILLTGQGGSRVDLEAMDAGASDYLDKSQINTDILDRSLRYSIKTKQALCESEQYHRLLLDNMLQGYAHCGMLFEQGRPKDFVLLGVNNAFENLTGRKNVAGEKISEVIPGIRESNPELLEVCGRVSESGMPERLEAFVEPLGMWFSISAYRLQKECFGVVFNAITERKRAEEEMGRLNRLYELLSQVNHCVARAEDREEFFTEVCRLIVERGDVDLAWIGLVDPSTLRIKPAAHFGKGEEILSQACFYADEGPEGQGNQGKAVREGQPSYCNRCGSDGCLYPSEKAPRQSGFQSCGSFPLRFQGQVLGVLNVCVSAGNFFGEREIKLLEEVATAISFALDKIEADIQRKRASEQFQRQSIFLGALMDAMPYPVYYKDAQLRYLGCNIALEQIFGVKREQIAGKTAQECWTKSFADHVDRSDLEVMANADRKTLLFETTAQVFDGARHDFLSYKATFQNQDGTVGGIVGAMVDITKRKAAEEALRQSEERFRQMAETIGEVFWLATPDFQSFLYVSRAFEQVWGRSTDDLYANPNLWRESVLPEDVPQVLSAIEDLARGQPRDVEFRITRPDQTVCWINARGYPMRDAAGKVILTSGVVSDITTRKRDEKKLLDSESKFRSYVENAPLAVLVADREGRILDFNRSAIDLLGYDAGTLAGMSASRIHPDEDGEIFSRDFATLLDNGRVEIERRVKRKDGQIRWVAIHAVMISEQLSLGYCLDITERRRAEEAHSRYLRQHEQLNQLQQALLGPGGLEEKLKMITDGVIDIFAADFCRIWCIGPGDLCDKGCMHASVTEGPHVCKDRDQCLHLVSSSGRYTHTDGAVHGRIPLGAHKIGLLASGHDHKFLSNDVLHEPRIQDREWASELGLVSFAGYQIRPRNGETLGVLALFSKQAITPEEDALLDALSTSVARVIRAARVEEKLLFRNVLLSTQQEASIDGILVVDEKDRILSYNRRFVEMWGLPPKLVEDGVDEPVLQFVTAQMADPRSFLQRVQYLYEHRQETSRDELLLADGRVFDRYSAPMFGSDDRYYWPRLVFPRHHRAQAGGGGAIRESPGVARDSPAARTIQEHAATGFGIDTRKGFLEGRGPALFGLQHPFR